MEAPTEQGSHKMVKSHNHVDYFLFLRNRHPWQFQALDTLKQQNQRLIMQIILTLRNYPKVSDENSLGMSHCSQDLLHKVYTEPGGLLTYLEEEPDLFTHLTGRDKNEFCLIQDYIRCKIL